MEIDEQFCIENREEVKKIAKWFAWHYNIEEHIDDLESVIFETLIRVAPTYNLALGVPFFAYATRSIKAALHSYVATNVSSYSTSAGHYRALRAAAYHYYKSHELNENERITYVADKLKLSAKRVRQLIEETEDFRYYENIVQKDEDGYLSEYVKDHSADPDHVVPQTMFMDEIVDIIEKKLTLKEQEVLFATSGIACIYCGQVCERKTYAEIASFFELSTPNAVDKIRGDAIKKILNELEDKGWM